MRRTFALGAAVSVLASLLVPLNSTTASASEPASTNWVLTVAGGGDGLSGPASRARLGDATAVDAASDGSVLVLSAGDVLRVDPATDAAVVMGTSDTEWPVDVAADGASAIVAGSSGVARMVAGSPQLVWSGPAVRAVDAVGGVIWAATTEDVWRITAAGAVNVTPTHPFGDAIDLAVTPDGSRAYVLDNGAGRRGVYEVTANGVERRVAGNLSGNDSFRAGLLATDASTWPAKRLTTDGTTITLSSREYRRVLRFSVGGVLAPVIEGTCVGDVTQRGADLAVACRAEGTVTLFSSAGVGRGRLVGRDPQQPWSPDGVRADDAYLDEVRGVAPLPGGGTVFTTTSGLVRTIDESGLLHTRARLDPIVSKGKVATGPDSTAYVVTDAGRVVAVTRQGLARELSLDAVASDVEVRSDGTLVVADARGSRLLAAAADGSGSRVLAATSGAPTDLGLDGDAVLVAANGLQRVGTDGSVSTLLTGGHPGAALRSRDGIWTGRLQGIDARAMVLEPDGGLRGLQAVGDTGGQAQAEPDGTVLLAMRDQVQRVVDAGKAPAADPVTVTATPGSGRVSLAWTPDELAGAVVRARRGTTAPVDMWDGQAAQYDRTVFRLDGTLVEPGEVWTFAVFVSYATAGMVSYRPASIVTSAALPDTSGPALTSTPVVWADHENIVLTYQDPDKWVDPSVDDFDHSVVRMSLGTTPPQTPTEGVLLESEYPGSSWHSLSLPNPLRGQSYSLSVFAMDFRGNYTRWSAVQSLDFSAPAPVGDVTVTPSYRTATVYFTQPTDSDYAGTVVGFAAGTAVPDYPETPHIYPSGDRVVGGLSMDTEYTVAVWTVDRVGNVGAPVLTRFVTLLDAVPPASPSGLTASGGDYRVTASWTNPTDADFSGSVAELVDPVSGAATACSSYTTKTSCTWTRVPGSVERTVRVRARDVNGNLSVPTDLSVTTNPDANGAPSIPEPVAWTADNPTTITVRFPRPTMVDLATTWYVVRPAGQLDGPVLGTGSLVSSLSTVTKSITLPDAAQTYDLQLRIRDFNGNVGETVLSGVHGGPDPSGRPSSPGQVQIAPDGDNRVKVSWKPTAFGASADSWLVKVSDGTTTKTNSMSGSSTATWFADLPGRTQYWATVQGVNTAGAGGTGRSSSVVVLDDTPPPSVSGAAIQQGYDNSVLRWTTELSFDFDRVEVLRRDLTAGTSSVIYRGRGGTVTAAGLLSGHTYRFEIRSYDLLGNTAVSSVNFTSQRSAASLGLPTSLRYGSTTVAKGQLTVGGKAMGGRAVSVFAQKVGSTTWTRVAGATTISTGAYAVNVKPTVSTRYRVGYAGSGAIGGAYSPTRTVTVAPLTTVKASRTSLYLGGTLTLSTTVAPSHAGKLISLQRWNGTTWVTITSRMLSSSSAASATTRPTTRGYHSYRWYLPGHTDHGAGVSSTLKVRVY